MANAHQEFRRTAQNIGQLVIRREEEEQSLSALKTSIETLNQFNSKLDSEINELGSDNHNGFTQRQVEEFDAYATELIDDAQSDYHRQKLEERLTTVRQKIYDKASTAEATTRVTAALDTLDQIALSTSSSTYHNPDSFKENIEALEETIDSQETTLPLKAREQLKAGSSGAIAEASLRGHIDTNPKRALELIDGGAYDNYLDGVKLSQLRGMAASQNKTDTSALRYEIQERMKDSIASSLSSGVDIDVPEEEIVELLGEDAVLKFRDDKADAQYIYSQSSNFEVQSIADIQAIVDAAQPTPGQPDFNRQQQRAEALTQIANSVVKARLEDPATAAAQTPRVKKIASQIENLVAQGDEEGAEQLFPSLVNLNMKTQLALGIPNHMTQPRPKAWAKTMVAEIEKMTPDQAQGALDAMASTYGDQYDEVFAQLVDEGLSPEYAVLGWVSGDAVADTVKQAISLKGEELKALFEDQAAFENMKTNVRQAMVPFVQAVMAGASTGVRISELNNYVNVIHKVAGIYTNRGMSETEAAEKAYSDIIGSKLGIKGSLYVPTKYGDVDVVHQILLERQNDGRRLENFNPMPFGSSMPGLSEKARKDVLMSAIKNEGLWITNESGTGAYLAVDLGGSITPIINAEGWRYEFKFDGIMLPDVGGTVQAGKSTLN